MSTQLKLIISLRLFLQVLYPCIMRVKILFFGLYMNEICSVKLAFLYLSTYNTPNHSATF